MRKPPEWAEDPDESQRLEEGNSVIWSFKLRQKDQLRLSEKTLTPLQVLKLKQETS